MVVIRRYKNWSSHACCGLKALGVLVLMHSFVYDVGKIYINEYVVLLPKNCVSLTDDLSLNNKDTLRD